MKPKSNSWGSDKAWKLDLKEKDIMHEGQVSSRYRHYLMAADDIQLNKKTVSKVNCHLLFCHLEQKVMKYDLKLLNGEQIVWMSAFEEGDDYLAV